MNARQQYYLQMLGVQVWSLNIDKNFLNQEVARIPELEAPALMIVSEDWQGGGIVGPAGQLLDAMLKAISLNREKVCFVTIPLLQKQLEWVKPKVLVAVGQVAAECLLDKKVPLDSLRGQEYRYGEQDLPLFITYDPAYLLRSLQDKAKAWQDLQQIARKLETQINI